MTTSSDLPAARILCADDNLYIREALRFTLTEAHFAVTCAGDGEEALHCLETTPTRFDVLITDHDMPRLNGLELVRALRSLPQPPPRVIVISGTLTEDLIARYEALAVARILPKPFMPQTIVETVEEVLEGCASPH
jgi:two-component system chemotaxis response regulator CheY